MMDCMERIDTVEWTKRLDDWKATHVDPPAGWRLDRTVYDDWSIMDYVDAQVNSVGNFSANLQRRDDGSLVYGYLTLPHWFPIAVTGAWPLLTLALARPLRRRRRMRRGLCVGCGYDLRGSTGPCPECGLGAVARPAPL